MFCPCAAEKFYENSIMANVIADKVRHFASKLFSRKYGRVSSIPMDES
jgi:hypothetical protein